MKRIIVYILTLAMLCTLLPACGGQQPQEASQPPDISSGTNVKASLPKEEKDEIVHRLLADWYGYLIRCEYLYGDMRWSLSYLDAFFEDHSWESLQIARAAMSSAKHNTETVVEKPLTAQMTVEDYDKLVQSGADVGWVSILIDGIQSLIDTVLLDYRPYQSYLNAPSDAFFLTHDLENFEEWAHIQQRLYDIYLHDFAVETDYLLLSLDSEEEETRFIEYIAEKCPQINALRKDNPQDPDALTELSIELTNELSELNDELASVVGKSQASLDLYRDVPKIETNDGLDSLNRHVDAIAADLVDDLAGFPIALPYPDWWYEEENETFTYFWDEPSFGEDKSHDFVMPLDTITSPPDKYVAEWAGVSKEDYLFYVENLEKAYNIPSLYSTEKEGTYTTFYEFRSASFAIIWEDEKVSLYTLEGSVCFAPYWYIYYTRRPVS